MVMRHLPLPSKTPSAPKLFLPQRTALALDEAVNALSLLLDVLFGHGHRLTTITILATAGWSANKRRIAVLYRLMVQVQCFTESSHFESESFSRHRVPGKITCSNSAIKNRMRPK
jgi:hypothetical protein